MAYGETYEEFVNKFKKTKQRNKTTDDCYTPPAVYDAVKTWAVKEYGWENRPVVRPFWPGGDYEHVEYPPDCVVIDNPPFSIISKIVRDFENWGMKYFLFAPNKTLFSITAAKSHIGVGSKITYENGAIVSTSFVASDGAAVRSAPELYNAIRNVTGQTKTQCKHTYPDELLTFSILERLSKNGIDYQENNVFFVRKLDAQKAAGKQIYGEGVHRSAGKTGTLRKNGERKGGNKGVCLEIFAARNRDM